MKLIINADDFGLSRGQNFGIIDSFRNGILKATTIMANAPATFHGIELAKEFPELDVGVHLVATFGKPLTNPHSLMDGEGKFNHLSTQLGTVVDPDELYEEWHRQIDIIIEQGIRPSHLDSHHHIHMQPLFLPIYLRLAKKFGLAIRIKDNEVPADGLSDYKKQLEGLRYAEIFRSDFYKEKVSIDYFDSLPWNENITVEVMSHPGYLDQFIFDNSSYSIPRALEVAVLTDKRTIDFVKDHAIELITFNDL